MESELKRIKDNAGLIQDLVSFLIKELNLQERPKLSFLVDKKNAANALGRTAYYDPEEKKIYLYVVNRHIKDVLRSLAHECVHHKQNLEGRIPLEQTEDGYFLKDEEMAELEREAFEIGNMIFRKFTELKELELKNKTNK